MKKLVCLLLIVLSLTACSKKEIIEEEEIGGIWKDQMADVVKESGKRIVIFQNLIEYEDSLEEFKAFGPHPEKETITIDGIEYEGYCLACLNNIWTLEHKNLIILDKKENEYPLSDLNKTYVIVNEDGFGSIVVNESIIKDFKYLISENNEALLFVDPEETLPLKDVLEKTGNESSNVCVTAVDGYWCYTKEVAEVLESEIRGQISGSVNCHLKLMHLKEGAGKVKDAFYIDLID